ncbi:hypothetical protein SEA_PAELLA_119 [Arthrobacter phage Paella]|nr:hypothetical protein SEA_PAELLA_119 [Arthrobacter phage Paella]
MASKKKSGHPAKQDKEVARLSKVLEASVELVRDLDGRLSPDAQEKLSLASLGLMVAYFELTGKPSPIQLILTDQEVVF